MLLEISQTYTTHPFIHKYHKGNHIGMDTSIIFQRVTKLSHILSKTESMSNFSKNLTIFLLFTLHLILSLCQKDFTWLAAFGGLLTTCSLLLIFSESSLSNHPAEYENLYLGREKAFTTEGGSPFGELVTEERREQILSQRKTSYNFKYQNLSYYFWCTISGTLIWAYAGFLNFLWK